MAPHTDDAVNRPNCTTERRRLHTARPTAVTDAAGDEDAEEISADAAAAGTGWKTGPAAVVKTHD